MIGLADVGGADERAQQAAAAILDEVRNTERLRIAAIRANDSAAMSKLLDDLFLYINSRGEVYDKAGYVAAVASHEITYAADIEMSETEHRLDSDLVVMAGVMLGHARLDREPEVYHARTMRVWRRRSSGWRLLAWQSSALW